MKTTFLLFVFLFCGSFLYAQKAPSTKERILAMSIEINASLDSVWSRWTSESGRRKFLAPASTFEFATMGRVEVLFNPAAPEGQRGAENNRLLSYADKEMISFTWDAPPNFPAIRKQRTIVVFRFSKLDNNKHSLHFIKWGGELAPNGMPCTITSPKHGAASCYRI
jgi:uncharacterized protein YndB with AHSA1/START domain